MPRQSRFTRGRMAAALVVGLLLGTMMSPAAAHVTSSFSHVVKHMKKVFFTKSQSNARYQRAACPRGMVKAGTTCIDRYEASVWSAPTGGVQYGVSSNDYPCDRNGQDCKGKIFARNVPGVTPSRFITWFQAQQALANSGKRLPTNAEWQVAVAGTPDSTTCNVNGSVANTGAHTGCISDWGANDMIGNLWEWVADWVPRSTGCGTWPVGYGGDYQCLSGASTTGQPGALLRGGSYYVDETFAGPFAINAQEAPSFAFHSVGFRGAK